MCPGGQRSGEAGRGGPVVRSDHPGSVGAAGLAGVTGRDARGDGVHWGVLEGPVLPAGGRLRDAAGQCRTSQARAGRKTDVVDAQWIAEVLSYGLLRPSFVPPRPFRELRDVTRYRKALIRARTSEVNRLHKVLEDAGVKLATVASDVMGVSGREMMRALIGGVANPQDLAELARARLRAKLPELRKALTARFRDHHAFLLARMLAHVEALEADIDVLSTRIAELTEPWQGQLMILDSITGVGPRAAEVILAEIGPDMSRFPTAGHLASWAGRCPGQRESAGRKGSAKPRKG